MRRAVVGGLLAPAAAWLAGCSPDHDWREVRADDGGFLVSLPARPARMTRPINLEGLAVEHLSVALARGPHPSFVDQTRDVRDVDLRPQAAGPARTESLKEVVGIQ